MWLEGAWRWAGGVVSRGDAETRRRGEKAAWGARSAGQETRPTVEMEELGELGGNGVGGIAKGVD